MKFTVAASIITQVLPVISEKSPSNLLVQDISKDYDFTMSRTLKSILRRIITRGKSRGRETDGYQSRQLLGGLLKNAPIAAIVNKPCDLSSNDPDIGILSCDAGYECVSDQDSTLRGLCTSISRDLQEPYPCGLCGYGSIMGEKNFYTVVDIPDNEGLTCGMLAFAAYVNFTLDATTCGPVSQFVKEGGCCVSYNCSLCGEGQELRPGVMFEYEDISLSCGALQPILNDTACALYGPYIAPTCCVASTTVASVAPTPAPSPSPSNAPSIPDTPSTSDAPAPPTSDSKGRWSTSSLISMASFAVATVGSLLLN